MARDDGLVEPVQVVLISVQDVRTGYNLSVAVENAVIRLVEDVEQHVVGKRLGGCCLGLFVGDATNQFIVSQVLPLHLNRLEGVNGGILLDTSVVSTLLDVKADIHFALLSFLCGNQNHTVRGTVTIKGGRGCVFQYRHRLDVGWVQVADVSTKRHAVEDVQRTGITVDGSHTANADAGVLTGLTVSAVHLHTRHSSLQGRGNARGGAHLNSLALHFLYRASQRGFLLCAISHHNHLVEVVGIVLHTYEHVGLGYLLVGNHSDVREAQHGIAVGDGKRKITSPIGYRTNFVITFQLHGCAHDRLAVVERDNFTSNLDLSRCHSNKQEQTGEN